MRAFLRMGLYCLFEVAVAVAQEKERTPGFEAASVKPALTGAAGMNVSLGGGPGTSDPGRISYTNVTLEEVVKVAYGMMGPTYDAAHKNDQLRGPDWLKTQKFTIIATFPQSTTKDNFKLMLQNLLAERFKLTLHRETKEISGYALQAGKNGPKLKESVDTTDAASERPEHFNVDKNGFRVFPPGATGVTSYVVDGATRLTASKLTMARFADMLGNMLASPVVDQTGLTGKYDFHLEFARPVVAGGRGGAMTPTPVIEPSDSHGVPMLVDAVQFQLGLKLEARKIPWDTLAIDHAEKFPTDN
jgi:uncharacterized protein (TIGR03435 family)